MKAAMKTVLAVANKQMSAKYNLKAAIRSVMVVTH